MTYIAIFISLIILRYSLLGQRTLQLQFYPIVLFLLFIFTAFRFQVGCDWSTYYQIYIDQTLPFLEKSGGEIMLLGKSEHFFISS